MSCTAAAYFKPYEIVGLTGGHPPKEPTLLDKIIRWIKETVLWMNW